MKVYLAYKIMKKISKPKKSKKLYKRVITMAIKNKEVRRKKSVVAVEELRGIQTPSFALI